MSRLYPPQRPWELEPHYSAHVAVMTAEGLHEKTAIAEQLAWRDQKIERLESRVSAALEIASMENVSEQSRAQVVIGNRWVFWKDAIRAALTLDPSPPEYDGSDDEEEDADDERSDQG